MNRREYITHTGMLLGYSLSFGSLAFMFDSCRTKSIQNSELFTKDQMELISQLAETIIPKSNTLGAIDTHTPEMIAIIVKDVYSPRDQTKFIDGLSKFEVEFQNDKGTTFLKAEEASRVKYLTVLDQESPKFPASMWGITLVDNPNEVGFFRKFKALTLMAYFTSIELYESQKKPG